MVLSFKKTVFFTMAIWIALITAPLIYSNTVTVGLAILYTGLLPFMLGGILDFAVQNRSYAQGAL